MVIVLWAAPSAFLGRAFGIVQPCAFLGIILCLLLLLPISRNEDTWRRLTFQGYDEEGREGIDSNPAKLVLGLLVVLPFIIFFGALVIQLTVLLFLR